ncbi:MAG TPA: ABC-type transport auxiliary lipoprotein family protein [Gemmatimonadaceae bacterium]|nr:ABC-type transport auxiliary lipoprotein family protein [Gemmatimonadaceae bacterium]
MTERVRLTVLAAALALSGVAACLPRGTLPSRELYRLRLPDTTAGGAMARLIDARRPPRPVLDGTIAIAPYRTSGLYSSPPIVFRIDEQQYGQYPTREWALPLSDMLAMTTDQLLLWRQLSEEPPLLDAPARLPQLHVWQGSVREFEEVNRGRDVFVSVALDARIVRTADEAIVWQGSARVEYPVPEGTMLAIVQAMSDAAAEVVLRLVDDARATIERTAPTARR